MIDCLDLLIIFWQREEAVKVFEHFRSVGVKPNAVTYSLLVDAHLIARDPKSAIYIINEMVIISYCD